MSCYKTTLLYIDSQDITVGDVNKFTVYTNNAGVSDVVEYAIQDITIPFSWNAIRSGRDTLQFSSVADGVLIATIPAGNYSANDLATEIGTQMTAAATTGTYTATYDSVTQSFTITCGGDTWSIEGTDLTASNLWDEIGFQAPATPAAAAHTSDSAINITGDNRLYITSSILSNNDSYESTSANQLEKSSNIATAIIDVNPGGIVQDRKQELVWREWPCSKVTTFDLQLRHSSGELVDLRGRHWQITIILKSKLP